MRSCHRGRSMNCAGHAVPCGPRALASNTPSYRRPPRCVSCTHVIRPHTYSVTTTCDGRPALPTERLPSLVRRGRGGVALGDGADGDAHSCVLSDDSRTSLLTAKRTGHPGCKTSADGAMSAVTRSDVTRSTGAMGSSLHEMTYVLGGSKEHTVAGQKASLTALYAHTWSDICSETRLQKSTVTKRNGNIYYPHLRMTTGCTR